VLAHPFSLIEHEKVQGLFRPSLETKLPVSATSHLVPDDAGVRANMCFWIFLITHMKQSFTYCISKCVELIRTT
jgi:hypothetical protein